MFRSSNGGSSSSGNSGKSKSNEDPLGRSTIRTTPSDEHQHQATAHCRHWARPVSQINRDESSVLMSTSMSI